MSEAHLDGIEAPEARHAAARAEAYRVWMASLDYPDLGYEEIVRSGALAARLADALAAVDPVLAASVDSAALSDPGEGEDALAVEYSRLFDVGAGGPPVPLYGGLYRGARMKVMEEAVRFYNFFGLGMSESPRELPDHLTTQLEFLHFLCFREAEALVEGKDPDGFRRAQRDFLARHPGGWVPLLVSRLARNQPRRFFSALFAALAAFLAHELATRVAALGPVPKS